jgi:hypothetical protein
MGANPKYETLGDIVRKGWNVAVQCGCGHTGVIDGARMERWYMCHAWPTQLHLLRDHLYCLRCGGRPRQARVRATADQPNAARGRFPSNEEGGKRLVRGLRG